MESKLVWNDITEFAPNEFLGKDVFIAVKETETQGAFIAVAGVCGSVNNMYFETDGGYFYLSDNITAWAEMPEVPEFGEGEAE